MARDFNKLDLVEDQANNRKHWNSLAIYKFNSKKDMERSRKIIKKIKLEDRIFNKILDTNYSIYT